MVRFERGLRPRNRGLGEASEGAVEAPPMERSRWALIITLANTRELLPRQHVHDPAPAHAGLQDHESVGILHDLADHPRLARLRPLAHAVEESWSVLTRDDGQELPFVGDIQRVQAQELADAPHRLPHGDGAL